MYQITVKEWTKIEKLLYEKNKEITDVKSANVLLELEIDRLKKAFEEVDLDLEQENKQLKKELDKQTKELKKANANLSTVLAKLNDTFAIMESIGYRNKADKLANRTKSISSRDIEALFDTVC